MILEWSTFWREFRHNFHTTGAVLPSSRFLARAITRLGIEVSRPARILEAGPGTGAFTNRLIMTLQPGDSLVLAELNDRFVDLLRRRIQTNAVWNSKQEQIHIHHGPVEELFDMDRFDAIVCGLPFNNFEPELVEQLFEGFLGRLEPGGTFSFFEYFGIRRLKSPLVGSVERQRLNEVAEKIAGFLQEYRISVDRVILNLPPAVVHHMRMPEG